MTNQENMEREFTEAEKPPFLYHGSPHRKIEELEPKRGHFRDPNEGPQIFATPELSIATTFLLEGISMSGFFDNVPYAVIVGDRESVIKSDNGGHVYVLPSDKFKADLNKGLGQYEWTADEKVKPTDSIEYKSAIDAMIESGVQLYFVDEKTYKQINKSSDHGWSLLNSSTSENQRRGINFKQLPKVED